MKPYLTSMHLSPKLAATVIQSPQSCSLNNEAVVQRRDGECSRRQRASFERFAYGVSDEFLNRHFHGPRAKRLLNAAPNQEFKGRFGDSEIEAALLEPLQFLRNGKAANFTLYVVARAV